MARRPRPTRRTSAKPMAAGENMRQRDSRRQLAPLGRTWKARRRTSKPGTSWTTPGTHSAPGQRTRTTEKRAPPPECTTSPRTVLPAWGPTAGPRLGRKGSHPVRNPRGRHLRTWQKKVVGLALWRSKGGRRGCVSLDRFLPALPGRGSGPERPSPLGSGPCFPVPARVWGVRSPLSPCAETPRDCAQRPKIDRSGARVTPGAGAQAKTSEPARGPNTEAPKGGGHERVRLSSRQKWLILGPRASVPN